MAAPLTEVRRNATTRDKSGVGLEATVGRNTAIRRQFAVGRQSPSGGRRSRNAARRGVECPRRAGSSPSRRHSTSVRRPMSTSATIRSRSAAPDPPSVAPCHRPSRRHRHADAGHASTLRRRAPAPSTCRAAREPGPAGDARHPQARARAGRRSSRGAAERAGRPRHRRRRARRRRASVHAGTGGPAEARPPRRQRRSPPPRSRHRCPDSSNGVPSSGPRCRICAARSPSA